jgi:hypothetical protein
VIMRSDERVSLAEGIMWEYEVDFMPEGMVIVDPFDPHARAA